MIMDRVTISGRSVDDGYELILRCLECNRWTVRGFEGVAPLLSDIEAAAWAHDCGQSPVWRED